MSDDSQSPAPDSALDQSDGSPIISDEQLLLSKALDTADLKMDWTNRRKVIFYSLIFLAALMGLEVSTLVFAISYSIVMWHAVDVNFKIDPATGDVLTSFFWASSLLASSIIFAYVFGSNSDQKNLRGHFNSIVSNFSSRIR